MSLAVLVRRFGDLVIDQAPVSTSQNATPYQDFPEELARLRSALNHHLIPLLTLARCDGEFADTERAAILTYCAAHLDDLGMTTSPTECAALETYVRGFKPARPQLALALKRLETEPRPRIARLIAAAQAVADADGVRRGYEIKVLAEIAQDLAALPDSAAR